MAFKNQFPLTDLSMSSIVFSSNHNKFAYHITTASKLIIGINFQSFTFSVLKMLLGMGLEPTTTQTSRAIKIGL